jgi:hypothetical protein
MQKESFKQRASKVIVPLMFGLLFLRAVGIVSEMGQGLEWWQYFGHVLACSMIAGLAVMLYERNGKFVPAFIGFNLIMLVYTFINLSVTQAQLTPEAANLVSKMYGQAVGATITWCAVAWWLRDGFSKTITTDGTPKDDSNALTQQSKAS